MGDFTTVDDASKYFQTKGWTGTGGSLGVTNDGNSDLQPDLIFLKDRTVADDSYSYDAVRGAQKKFLPSDNDAESTDSNGITAFNSDGFTVGSADGVNKSSSEMISWQWKEAAGGIFDIVSYTGTGSAHTISHSLGAKPAFMICKRRSEAGSWAVYHRGNSGQGTDPATDYQLLDVIGVQSDDATVWNDTEPTSSVFSVGTSDHTNKNTITYIAYLWSELQGYSKFGQYMGNGHINGTFNYCGFQPEAVIIKGNSDTGHWVMHTNSIYLNGTDSMNTWSHTDAEAGPGIGAGSHIDFLSNGFKLRGASAATNANTYLYTYMAWAKNPFVTSGGVAGTAN